MPRLKYGLILELKKELVAEGHVIIKCVAQLAKSTKVVLCIC